MCYRYLLLIFILTILSPKLTAQYQEQLHQLIASEGEIGRKQQMLDDFFIENSSKMEDAELANCYHDLAFRWYYKELWIKEKNDTFLNKSVFYFIKAAKIKRSGNVHDDYSLKRTLYNLGAIYSMKGKPFKAIQSFQEIITTGIFDKKALQAYQELTKIYSEIGDYHKALENSSKLLNLLAIHEIPVNNLIQEYITRADTYSMMGFKENSDSIQANLKQASNLLKTSTLKPTIYNSYIDQIEGNRLLETGDYRSAIPHFNRVLDALHPYDSVNQAVVHNSLGQAYNKLEIVDSAHLFLKKATLYNPGYTLPYENLGDLYLKQKSFSKALSCYQQAIEHIYSKTSTHNNHQQLTKQDLELASDKYYLLHHLTQKAKAWKQYYVYKKNKNLLSYALKTYKLADKLVDIIRFESKEYKSKLYWRAQSNELYAEAVEVCFWLQRPEDAYYFMEKNKALLLLEDLTNEQAKSNAGIPIDVAAREYDLKQSIYLSESKLRQAEGAESIQHLKDKIYDIKQQYQNFVDSLARAYPIYAINKEKISISSYPGIRKKYTSPSAVILQYVVGKEKAFGLLTTSKESFLFKINHLDSLQQHILTWQTKISKRFTDSEQLHEYNKVSFDLFRKLIPSDVYTMIKNKKLIIVPDHTLQQVSFETLNTSIKDQSYLINDVETRYVYSMSFLERNNQIQRKASKTFMGLAPVNFYDPSLSSLHYSKDEVISLAQLFSGDLLLNEKASKKTLLDTIYDYQIIHLSTHAGIGPKSDPWIACQDAKVSLNEIYATKNQSDMVVLSACKTSLGALKEGEGIMSMARGFFHSGAKSVVSTLWATNDKSTREIMVHFYEGLHNGRTKSEALREAKLKYIKNHYGTESSPFYWGNLILIGDNQPLTESADNQLSSWIWLILLLICSFIALFLYKRRSLAQS